MNKIKIDINKEVTSKLPFTPFPQFNDLCVGYLTDVEVYETKSSESKNWEFAGYTIPILAFRFTQYKLNVNEKDRFMTMSFMPISNTLSDGTDRLPSKLLVSYNQMFDKIRHLHDQYAGNENYSKFTTQFEFDPSLPIEDRIAEFKSVFESVVNDFKIGKDKKNPVYKEKQNLFIVMVASGKSKSYLSVPDFVGKGIFDLYKVDNKGKADTTLLIPVNATTKLGSSAVADIPINQGTAASGLPKDLQDLMNSQPQ